MQWCGVDDKEEEKKRKAAPELASVVHKRTRQVQIISNNNTLYLN